MGQLYLFEIINCFYRSTAPTVPSSPSIQIYDCTLREGAQAPHISFSLQDKLRITEILDELGVAYTEGGWPAANPKDLAYFQALASLRLQQLTVVGFASTFTAKGRQLAEENIRTFKDANIQSIHLFGKAWDFHVHQVLGLSLEENLDCIAESIRFFKEHIPEVSFGAEHLFDGYKANPTYVAQLLKVAQEAGADWIDLADTNGGCFPSQVGTIVAALRQQVSLPLAVHCHDDTGCAVANTIAAIENGVTIAEGTINGYAERCQMTDLCTLIPNLQLKLGYQCIPAERMASLTSVARQVAEIVQVNNLRTKPYVGQFAFAHKAGMHVDAHSKSSRAYQHIDPSLVGNESTILVSDQSGRKNLAEILASMGMDHHLGKEEISELLATIKEQEMQGYQFELSLPALKLLILRQLGHYQEHIQIETMAITHHYRQQTDFPFDLKTCLLIRPLGPKKHQVELAMTGISTFMDMAQYLIDELRGYFLPLADLQVGSCQARMIFNRLRQHDRLRVLITLNQQGQEFTSMGFGNNFISAALHALLEGIEYILHTSLMSHISQPAQEEPCPLPN